MPSIKPVVTDRLEDLSTSFERYVDIFRNQGPFSGSQLRAHQEALRRRALFPSASMAVADTDFADAVRKVLKAWRIGGRKTKMIPPTVFRTEIAAIAPRVAGLTKLRLEDPALDAEHVASQLWALIDSMCLVTRNGEPVQNKIVSGTKALHHVLPELVFPIDRKFTQAFFGWHNPEFQRNSEQCFTLMFEALAKVARVVQPTRLIGERWMMAPAKIVDNAIVGYCLVHGLVKQPSAAPPAENDRRVTVFALPALSHSDRVRTFVIETYVTPARRRGQTEIQVRAGDIDHALGFRYRRLPLICSALRSNKFLRTAQASLMRETGPPSGASTTTTFFFQLSDPIG